MTKLRAYTAWQDQFGKEQAQTLADFIESQESPDLSRLVTKDDLQLLRQDTKDEIQLIRQDMKDLEIRLIKELAQNREESNQGIAKAREDMISRMNWTTIIQVLTTIGALAALAKII